MTDPMSWAGSVMNDVLNDVCAVADQLPDPAQVASTDRTIEALRAGETPSDERLVRLLAAMRAWVREGES